ncbi:MAG: DNA-3-methyladenine glycosylase 2 family protein [Clostridia bacterium]|nr:DNA-3-methyladenine glycosylase 2 family protein [Clostridia bacterium]
MDYEKISFGSGNGVPFAVIEGVRHFDADRIFDCGQCFRFSSFVTSDGHREWCGAAGGKYIAVRQEDRKVTVFGTDEQDFYGFYHAFLGLGDDYGAINRDILSRSDNPRLLEALTAEDGIRILKQERWEALCSFIISQNNNIPRIKSLVSALCERCGIPAECAGMEAHGAKEKEYAFPSPGAVAELGVEELSALKTGFRAEYIHGAAVALAEGRTDFESVASAGSYAEAAAELMALRGVGPKVAACALLFGFGRLDAFPVDVWVKRIIARYFGENFDPCGLGPYAGVAQQYLFRYERGFDGN